MQPLPKLRQRARRSGIDFGDVERRSAATVYAASTPALESTVIVAINKAEQPGCRDPRRSHGFMQPLPCGL
jgi:hypothetical protein